MTPIGWAKIDYAIIDRIGELGVVPFAVYCVLAKHADEQGRCWPSEGAIGEIMGRDSRTVRRALRALEDAGLLHQQRRGRGATAVYTLIQDRTPMSALDAKTGHPCPPRPDTGDRKTGHQCPVQGNKNQGTRTKEQEGQDRTPMSAQRFDPLDIRLPFGSDRFRTAWQDFAEHRRSIKHPLTAPATTRILAKLERWGEPAAVDALDLAIENGWRGVFEPKSNGKPHAEDPAPFDN